jgi:uncharacterized membrane protein YccC
MDVMDETAKPSLLKRLLALVVLAVAAWILLKFVIGLIAGVATLVVIVLCLVAVVWALRVL